LQEALLIKHFAAAQNAVQKAPCHPLPNSVVVLLKYGLVRLPMLAICDYPMRYAVVSDIHANRQAWQAVLDDIALQGTDAILCVGDVIGYGPMPAVTLDSVCKYADVMVLGNHDAVIGNRINVEIFNDDACRIIEWTRERLNDDATRLFAKMPLELEVEDFLIVHAEVADPERFYYIEEAESARESFDACEHALIFVGHTQSGGIRV